MLLALCLLPAAATAQIPACPADGDPNGVGSWICLSPVVPNSGQAFALRFRSTGAGLCQAIQHWHLQSGNAINLYVAHASGCGTPPVPLLNSNLPGLPAGDYTVNLHRRSWDGPAPPFDPADYPLAITETFQILGGPALATPVPVLGGLGAALLILLFLIVAFRRRQTPTR